MSNARRSKLMTLLSEACEIEHGLACSYLYAAFSLRRGQDEGLSFQQEQLVRRWSSQLSFVATQEMLHLAQAWNLLQAIGGTPYHTHPSFPLERAASPIPVKMSLEGFSLRTIDRFLDWERPEDKRDVLATGETYPTVGALYHEIRRMIEVLPESALFIGDPELQVGSNLVDFPDVVRVCDRKTALDAIDAIRAQGEGTAKDHQDCHFGIFTRIRLELASASKFAPAFGVVANPVWRATPGATLVTNNIATSLMALFDDVYALSIRVLGWIFGPARPTTSVARRLARLAIAIMPVILRPFGELIMRLPSGIDGLGAGPSFSISRHVPLPDGSATAERLVNERLHEIIDDLASLSKATESGTVRLALAGLSRKLKQLAADTFPS